MPLLNSSSADSVFTPLSLEQFLATEKWSFTGEQRGGRIWRSPADIDGTSRVVFLPWDAEFVDFRKRLSEAVDEIGRYFRLSADSLMEKVASARADLFFVRVDQPMLDGTIPLSQASDLLLGIEKMVRAAATTAASPGHSHRGRLPRGVNDFMDRDVRMGHTKNGSFIITVVARLDDEADRLPKVAERDLLAYDPATERDDELDVPFTRRVMMTLSKGLSAAHRHVSSDAGEYLDMEHAVSEGLSLPMVQALNAIGSAEALRRVDLSFDWSPTEPIDPSTPDLVTIDKGDFDALISVERKMRKQIQPRAEVIMGQVHSLQRGRPDEDGVDNGTAVISTEVRGKLKRVHVPLSGDDYAWAVVAHHEKLVFSASGSLEKIGRNWTLTGRIVSDLSHLQRVTGSTRPPRWMTSSAI